jgi:hypothetical protein
MTNVLATNWKLWLEKVLRYRALFARKYKGPPYKAPIGSIYTFEK